MKRRFLIWLLPLTCIFSANVFAQQTVTVKSAESLSQVIIDGQKAQKLVDNVWLQHEDTDIRCDSAYFFIATNSAKAFGHVTIIDEIDKLNLKGDYLEYSGDTRIAKIRENVILKDDSADLYTNYLDFDRNAQIGYYSNGGKLVDSTNVLTSLQGFYNTETKESQFIDSVHLVSPDFEMWTDTLNYTSQDKIAIARGKTLGHSQEGDTLTTNTGLIYNSRLKYSEVYFGTITTADYKIKGDTLFANDSTRYYQGDLNVRMTSFQDSLTIFGDRMRYDRNKGHATVYERAYLRKMMQNDSLFIRGDTLVSVQDTIKNEKYLTAYKDVQMYKSDMQGKADSVSYNMNDSTIYMYQDPVIWNIDSQIEADSVNIQIANNKIHRMNLSVNSFVITQDSVLNFNQVKGRSMVIHFDEGFITKADVNGNGESIYFTIDRNNNSSSMNKVVCSNMAIYFEDNVVSDLRMYRQVDGNFVPPPEIKDPDKRLRGFEWKATEKPKLLDIARHLQKPAIKLTKESPPDPVKKG